jgi:hypothetical protein
VHHRLLEGGRGLHHGLGAVECPTKALVLFPLGRFSPAARPLWCALWAASPFGKGGGSTRQATSQVGCQCNQDLSVRPSTCVRACPSVRPSVRLCVCLSVCLSPAEEHMPAGLSRPPVSGREMPTVCCVWIRPSGPVALQLYEALTGIQQERIEDPFGWVHPVPAH